LGSRSAWHSDEVHPLIARLSQKASAITNLTLETVEHLQVSGISQFKPAKQSLLFQVLNYGIGGLYEPHWDFVQVRLQSVMFLLLKEGFSGRRKKRIFIL
jgi:prolyl 4-hydroxylase